MDIPRKNSKRNRWLRRGLYITITMAILALTTLGLSRLEPAVPSVDRRILLIDTVRRGSMVRQVRGVGNLVSEDVLVVPATVGGRVVRILVEPGTVVDANTVILELSNPELELQWLNAQSELNSAKARLDAQKTQLQDQLLGMEAEQARMEANLREARLALEVDEKQFDEDLISELNLSLSKARVEEQEKLLEISKKRLAMYRDHTSQAQLSEQESVVHQAESLLKLRTNQIESLRVRAGTAGVLAPVKEKIELGQSISAGTVLAKITNPKRLKARLKVPQGQAREITIGLSAIVDTHNDTISGKVSRIDPTVMEGNVTVDITLNSKLPDGARPDLSVVGTIEIERLSDIIYVGRPANASGQSTAELYKLTEEGKYAVRSRIQLGRSSVSSIEVLEGLMPGDEVILSDMSRWDEHDKIRLK